jgi:hypothetical protein
MRWEVVPQGWPPDRPFIPRWFWRHISAERFAQQLNGVVVDPGPTWVVRRVVR